MERGGERVGRKKEGQDGRMEGRKVGRKDGWMQRKDGLDFFSDWSLHPENNLSPIQAFVGYKISKQKNT